MHYERAPRFRRSKPDEAPPPLRCAVQGFAPLRRRLGSNCNGGRGAKELQKDIGKSAGEWHFTLRGKTSVGTNEFPPKEATRMSYDVKYIGMDVHKEAIVIAVQNESGKLVMESVIETKASSILQFLHGLRGELHVTWEEGTWAAWLYDLLQPHVQHIVVCNPRRNALLKEGSKSDKVDAQKLADLLRTGMLRPVYHGENGLRTLRELGRSYQTISKDLTRVMNRLKALYRGWSIPCAGTQVYAARSREEWLSKIRKPGCAAERSCSINSWTDCRPCGERCDPNFWPRAGNISRETAAPDSLHRSDSSRPFDRADANPAPVPQQAATLDLQWAWH